LILFWKRVAIPERMDSAYLTKIAISPSSAPSTKSREKEMIAETDLY
jgi:hypothetical protein